MLQGKNFIEGTWIGSDETVTSVDLPKVHFAQATVAQVERACQAARNAFTNYSRTNRSDRAVFLNQIADEIVASSNQFFWGDGGDGHLLSGAGY